MNPRYHLLPLVIVSVIGLAPQFALSQVPTLWSKCHAAAFDNFVISWRAVEKVIEDASKQEIDQFVTWVPDREAIRGGNEDIFLFVWARLDDKGLADIRNLESRKIPWSDTTFPDPIKPGPSAVVKLRMTQDHRLLLRFVRSIESDGQPDPFDFGIIRCLGLVPFKYIDETIAELRKYCHETSPDFKKYCDPSSQKPEATGIYGEEMFEIQDMLEYRKTGVLFSANQ